MSMLKLGSKDIVMALSQYQPYKYGTSNMIHNIVKLWFIPISLILSILIEPTLPNCNIKNIQLLFSLSKLITYFIPTGYHY